MIKTENKKPREYKKYPDSWLDTQRRKYNIPPIDLYRGLGWHHTRYYMHVLKRCRFPLEDIGKLALILGCNQQKLLESYLLDSLQTAKHRTKGAEHQT